MIARLYSLAVVAAALILSVVLAASLLNRLHPAFDSLAHFRLHILAALLVTIILAGFAGLRKTMMAAGTVAIVALAMTVPYLPGLGPWAAEFASPTGIPVRIVDFNTRFDNHETGLARDVISAADPDIIILQEVTDTPASLMNLLRQDYPVQIRCEGSAIGGAAVIARLPLAGDDAIRCFDTPFLSAIRLDISGRTLTVASYHAHWPWPHSQHGWIDRLAKSFAGLQHPLVIGGDFNATPWSEGVQRVARASGTHPVPGMRPSWLTPALPRWLRPYAGLPIDHLLISDDILDVEARTLPYAGSDHLPVLYRIVLP